MGNGTDKWYLSGVLGIGTNEPGKMLHIQGSSSAPLLNDSYDRPGLAITGSYPELDLFSEANNPNHGPTIRLGSYNNDNKDSFKQWVIGTSGRNSSFLDIGFSNRNDPNPHAGIRNHNGTTLFTILENGNVGIGTTTPKAHLEIMQTFSTSLPFQPVLSIVTRGLRFLTESAGGVINSCDSDGTIRPLTLQKGGGNVGIGTTNPTHPIHVKTDWGFLALDSNAAGQDSGVRLMEGGAVKWHMWNSARDAKFYLARDGLNATLALDQSGNVDIGLNPLRISSGWTGSPDGVTNKAEISNDIGGFKTLMIVGNNSAGMGRRVSVWDRLEVNGILTVSNAFQLGNGAVFNKFQTGTTSLGSNGVDKGSVSFSISFPQPFSSIPKVIATARDVESHGDVFVVSTKGIHPNGFSINVRRLDSWPVNTWGQNLHLDWFAWI